MWRGYATPEEHIGAKHRKHDRNAALWHTTHLLQGPKLGQPPRVNLLVQRAGDVHVHVQRPQLVLILGKAAYQLRHALQVHLLHVVVPPLATALALELVAVLGNLIRRLSKVTVTQLSLDLVFNA